MVKKTTGQINISKPEVQKYLKRNKTIRTFLILNQSLVTCNARLALFKERAQQCRDFILRYQSLQENITYDIVKLQLMHLELLANIFMLLEDFLGHSHNLKLSALEYFPKLIASRNERVASCEISALAKLRTKDMSNYLLFPSIVRPNCEEQQLLDSNLKNMAKDTLKRIKNILQFYSRYYRVYVKYEHILPAVLGVHHKKYDTKQNLTVAISYIYIRDYLGIGTKRSKLFPIKKINFIPTLSCLRGLSH